VNLPADPVVASEWLASGEAQIDAAQQALEDATRRLDALVQAQRNVPSFSVDSPAAALGEPEKEALALLNEIQTGQPAVAFGLGEKIDAGFDKAAEKLEAFVEGMLRSIMHYAWVETQIEGRLICRTAVGWTGDADTVWLAEPDAAIAALHQRTLRVAIASRNTLIKTFSVAAQGAAKLATLLATPGGAVMALPAAWKFINQIVDELEQRRSIAQQPRET
jgi:hypothetical protein